MADETVEIPVSVPGADEATEKFTRLQTQIRETKIALQQAAAAGDSVKFNQLKSQLDDLEDGLEKTNLKSRQFDDALAGLPGPAGQAGKAMKGLDGAFKLIAANPIVATIAGLSALFLALRESLTRTEEGTAALSRITEGFERVLNGIFAIIEPLAMAFADFVGDLLENQKAMKFLGTTVGVLGGTFSALFSVLKALGSFVVNNFINVWKSLTGVLGGVGSVLEGIFTFNYSKIKAGVQQVANTVVTGFNDLVDNISNTTKGIVTAVTDDFTSGFNAAESAFDAGTKRLTKKEREAKKKRDEQAAKDAEEAAKKEKERRLKIIADQEAAEAALRKQLHDERKQREADAVIINEKDQEGIFTRRVEREKMLAANLATVQNFAAKTTEENTQKQIEIEEKAFQARQALLYGISAAITAASDLVGRNTVAGKALAVSATLINTYASIAGQLRAFAGVPIPGYAIAQAIATGLVGLKAVRDIIAVKVPTTSGGGAGGAGGVGSIGGGAQAPTPAFANTAIGAPQVGAAAGQTGTLANIVAGSINQNQSQVQPIRAYVIGNEVTTQQQLDRRISTAARLGG